MKLNRKKLRQLIKEFVDLEVDLKKRNQEVPQSLVLVITYFPRPGAPEYKDPKFEVYDEITGETKPVVPGNPDVTFNSGENIGVYDPMKVLVLAMTNGCGKIYDEFLGYTATLNEWRQAFKDETGL